METIKQVLQECFNIMTNDQMLKLYEKFNKEPCSFESLNKWANGFLK